MGCGSGGHSHVSASGGASYITPTIFVAFTPVRAYVLNLHSDGMSVAAGGELLARLDSAAQRFQIEGPIEEGPRGLKKSIGTRSRPPAELRIAPELLFDFLP
jgi:hypothetical protein